MRTSLDQVARLIDLTVENSGHLGPGPFDIGIDGPDCSGKSTLSRRVLRESKKRRSTICLHFDDFSNSVEHRTQRGEFSVDAFYFDFFDVEALVSSIGAVTEDNTTLGLLIVEGLFLYRQPLRDLLKYKVRIEIDDVLVLNRALFRDVGRLGDADWVQRHYREQCIPAQRRYIREHLPSDAADLLLIAQDDGSFHVGC